MNNDPISQLPEPYRAAWEILQEPYDHDLILQKILVRAKEIANAESGIIFLEYEFTGSFPEFHVLPDMKRYVPIGTTAWLLYAFAKQTIQDGQGRQIVTSDETNQAESLRLIDKYVPLKMRETIIKYANDTRTHFSLFELPDTIPLNTMFVPILLEDKVIGAVCLSRSLSLGAFSIEALEQVRTFLSFVGRAIKNAKIIRENKWVATENLFSIYHELKVPVVSIQGYASLLLGYIKGRQDKVNLTDEQKESFLKTIYNNAEYLRYIIDTYSIETKLDIHSILYHPESVKLRSLVMPAIDKYRALVQLKGQSLTIDITDEILDIELSGSDYYYLYVVIEALIRNAYMYTSTGGSIKILASVADQTLNFRFSDTGLGLTPEEISKLFEKYHRSDRSEIREQRGAGMGLYLAKRLLDLWGGKIGAEGSPNQGSTFWFTLPLTRE